MLQVCFRCDAAVLQAPAAWMRRRAGWLPRADGPHHLVRVRARVRVRLRVRVRVRVLGLGLGFRVRP